jgi:hypothetical protein
LHEKLALLGLGRLTADQAFRPLDEIQKEVNLQEVVETIMKAQGLEYEGRQLVCGDRLRAAFVTQAPRTIIDLIEHQISHVSKDGEVRLRLRGRIADRIAKDHGFEGGYRVVSLVEMDFAKDE